MFIYYNICTQLFLKEFGKTGDVIIYKHMLKYYNYYGKFKL